LALALRLALFVSTLPTPERFLYAPDSYEYDRLAQNLAAGHGFSISASAPFEPDLRRTPVYPALLALVFWATNHNLASAILVNVAVSVITVALTYGLASRLFGVPVAVGASLIMATDVTSITYSNLLLTEVTFTALLLMGILVLVDYVRAEHPSRAIVGGIFLGLSALCRPIGIFLGATTLPVFVIGTRGNGIRSRLFSYFLLNVSCLLLLGIWLLRNYLTFGGADFSSVGAVNFYFHRAAAVQALIEGVDELTVRARWEREFASLSGGWSEEQKASWLNGQAMELIGQHPVLYALVYGRGLLRMMEPEQNALTDLLGWEYGSIAAGLLAGVGWLQLLIVYALVYIRCLFYRDGRP
jgi:4-amino-4-deoxy-L-arabinose transferase-like glycosyltransferase